jgi:hypothetical protein
MMYKPVPQLEEGPVYTHHILVTDCLKTSLV